MPRRQVQSVSEAVAAINARYGAGTLIKASDPSLIIEHLPTGILALDVVMGGFARGRHIEIYGGYGVGKTYTAYKFIATSQAAGLKCAFLDVEGTFDPTFAASVGVDLDALEFPTRGQNANRLVNVMEVLLRSEEYDVIVLDSIAALLPKDEEDADMESGSYGMSQAKLMSQALRRLTVANQRRCACHQPDPRGDQRFGKQSITSAVREK
jgi:recombination protein RecA